jgi:hypothetical protein
MPVTDSLAWWKDNSDKYSRLILNINLLFTTQYTLFTYQVMSCHVTFGHCGTEFEGLNRFDIPNIYIYIYTYIYIYIYMDVVEWSRALDVRLSEWCCSVDLNLITGYSVRFPIEYPVTR